MPPGGTLSPVFRPASLRSIAYEHRVCRSIAKGISEQTNLKPKVKKNIILCRNRI